jgi:ATP-dependent RNA helicase RhlE
LNNFKRKSTKVLVATDIAARGIDVDDLCFVINYELPNSPETYIHRIGRTGRAGTKGVALSFCDSEERSFLKDINKLPNIQISIVREHPYESTGPVAFEKKDKPKSFGSSRPRIREAVRTSNNKSSEARPRRTWTR